MFPHIHCQGVPVDLTACLINGDAQHHRGTRGQTKAPRRQASVKAESLAPVFVSIEGKEGPLFDVLRNSLVEEGRIKGFLGRLRSR